MTIRVVAADDSYLAREGITAALAAVDGIELVEMCTDLETLRAAVERVRPDVVLTDVRMPPDHTDEGIRVAVELRSSHPEVGVVVLSQHADPLYAVSLFEQGSDGRAYLLKERLGDRAELARAVTEVAAGGSYVDARIVDRLLTLRARRDNSPLGRLTEREHEVLAMIAEGRSNTAIADEMSITKRAVERHVNGIFAKLELGDPESVSRRVKAALIYLAGQTG